MTKTKGRFITMSMNLDNFAIARGRLTQDVTLLPNSDGSQKALVKVAVKNNYKNKNGEYDTQFIPLEGFIKKGDNPGVYALMHKGDLVAIQYDVRSSSYQKDGKTEYKTTLTIQQVTLCESKSVTDDRLARRAAEAAAGSPVADTSAEAATDAEKPFN